MVHSKFDEQKIVLDTLSHYQVGDVTNFYRTINKRQTSYIANLMGYPPPPLQDREEREVLEKSCLKIRDLLYSIGYYFLLFFDLYNAYKHGYRTIPTTINDYDEGIIIVKDCGEPALLRLELNDIDKMFGLSSHCRSLLQNLVENHRLAVRVIITRFTGQVMAIRNLLAQMGLLDNYNIKVTTTTTALGTQADIVLFSLVRNNLDKTLGALAELPDLNVSISRAKKKLIIVGSFDMMADGHGDRRRSKTNYAHNLAKLIESRYGKVIEVPEILR
jgi:hypothetical protein